MGRRKKDVFKHQLKTVQNIADRIQALIETHRSLNGNILNDGDVDLSVLKIVFRTVSILINLLYMKKVTMVEEGLKIV